MPAVPRLVRAGAPRMPRFTKGVVCPGLRAHPNPCEDHQIRGGHPTRWARRGPCECRLQTKDLANQAWAAKGAKGSTPQADSRCMHRVAQRWRCGAGSTPAPTPPKWAGKPKQVDRTWIESMAAAPALQPMRLTNGDAQSNREFQAPRMWPTATGDLGTNALTCRDYTRNRGSPHDLADHAGAKQALMTQRSTSG